jgi:hypothetical protein
MKLFMRSYKLRTRFEVRGLSCAVTNCAQGYEAFHAQLQTAHKVTFRAQLQTAHKVCEVFRVQLQTENKVYMELL